MEKKIRSGKFDGKGKFFRLDFDNITLTRIAQRFNFFWRFFSIHNSMAILVPLHGTMVCMATLAMNGTSTMTQA